MRSNICGFTLTTYANVFRASDCVAIFPAERKQAQEIGRTTEPGQVVVRSVLGETNLEQNIGYDPDVAHHEVNKV
jgi:hypothetical protein